MPAGVTSAHSSTVPPLGPPSPMGMTMPPHSVPGRPRSPAEPPLPASVALPPASPVVVEPLLVAPEPLVADPPDPVEALVLVPPVAPEPPVVAPPEPPPPEQPDIDANANTIAPGPHAARHAITASYHAR